MAGRHFGSALLLVLLQSLLWPAGAAGTDQELRYVVSWNSLPAAHATVRLTEASADALATRLAVSIRTNPVVDIFWSLRAESWGEINPTTLQPTHFEYVRRINGRPETTLVEPEGGLLTGRYSRPGRYHLIESSDPQAIDPIAAVLRARYAVLTTAKPSTYEVFTGEAHYRIVLEPRGREAINVPAGHFAAIRIEPTIWRVEDRKQDTRVRQLTVWLTEAVPHTLLRVRSELFFGALYLDLMEMLPAAAPIAQR